MSKDISSKNTEKSLPQAPPKGWKQRYATQKRLQVRGPQESLTKHQLVVAGPKAAQMLQ
jgi:hypothetical protein